jgi:hypothetical protein
MSASSTGLTANNGLAAWNVLAMECESGENGEMGEIEDPATRRVSVLQTRHCWRTAREP